MIDLRSRIGKVETEGVVGNSPGPLKDHESWAKVARSVSAFVRAGSFCAKAREGNSGEVYYTDQALVMALNSLGLPCKDPEAYVGDLEALRKYGKPIIVSVAGFKPEEFILLAHIFGPLGYSLELNLTCPNVEGHGVFAYDIKATKAAIAGVRDVIGGQGNLIIKLNPHPDLSYIKTICRLVEEEKVDAVALCNTVPNCMLLNPDTLRPVITPNRGLAGLSGGAIFPIVLGQVFQYREAGLQASVIFEGGANTGREVIQALAVGADAVCSATDYSISGVKVLQRKTEELIEEMERLELNSIEEIRQKFRGEN